MDYDFRLGKGRSFMVRGWANLPVELVGALAGVKPALHAWIEAGDEEYLRELCAAFRFELNIFARSEFQGRTRLEAILGPDKTAVRKAAACWNHPSLNPGPYLGYPPCCVAFFRDWSSWARTKVGKRGFIDILPRVFANSNPPGGFSFLLNDAFYCYSRHWGEGDDERRRAVGERNPGIDLASLNILSWHPCSYHCAASLAAGRKIWSVMRAVVPELAAQAGACLGKPVLFWDWSRYAVLKGECPEQGECVYSGIAPPFSLAGENDLALLRSGDRLLVRKDRSLCVYKCGTLVGAFRNKPPLLLDFGLRDLAGARS